MKHSMTLLNVVAVSALMGVALGATGTVEAGKTCGGGPVIRAARTPYGSSAASEVLAITRMRYCCFKSAEAGMGCCGKSAAAVKARYNEMRAANMVLASMRECCAAAVKADKGCCGKDVASMQAAFAAQLVDARAQVSALDGMRSCCAEAVQAHRGCCGRDAAALSTAYAQMVADAKARQMNGTDGC